jgi:hypothetical protein
MAAWEEVRRVLRALFPPEQTETTSAAPVASAKSLKVARTNNKRAAGKAKPPAAAADARPGPGAGKNKPPAPTLPTGFEPEILGKGFRLVYGKDPMTNRDAYRVEVNGQDVGWLRKEDERRWVLYSPSDAFPQSIHRNVLGAHTRIETIYEPRD